jgi:hypothetical protein
MIPTAEEVRRMSIDARGTQRPPAPTPPPAQPVPAVPPAPARAHFASKKPGATGGAWLVPVAIIVLIVALTLAGVLIIRGMRRAHPTSAPAPTPVVSVSASVGGERP